MTITWPYQLALGQTLGSLYYFFKILQVSKLILVETTPEKIHQNAWNWCIFVGMDKFSV